MPQAHRPGKQPIKISHGIVFCLLAFSFTLMSCGNARIKELEAENDSLRHEIITGGHVVNALVSVNTLLDSIDATRHVMRMNQADGLERKSYDQRMIELKDYIKQTEEKLGELEASMVETNVNSESYVVIITALKDELRIRNEELGLIEENSELNNEVMLKGVQLEDVEARLDVKKTELKMLELQIKELVKRMGISEAEGLYAQAGAMEEAARRTKLAPFKRRQTYREALALYEKSLAKGKKEAKAKVDELRAKVGPDED
jgi:chromosome segregation ATPase